MRLIDAVTAADAVSEKCGIPIADLVDVFADIQTVDAVSVRHGYWVIADADKGEYICSVCGETDTDCSDRYSNHNVFGQNYCPNCGAKMDGDEI